MRIMMYDDAGQEQGLVLQNRNGVVSISYMELEYVEVINKTVAFHLADGAVHEVSAALADFEGQLLSRPEFLKTHRSYLVNLQHVYMHLGQPAGTEAADDPYDCVLLNVMIPGEDGFAICEELRKLVQVHMSRLRRKLEKAGGEQRFIETVWGEGYRFVPDEC